ncbi:hypothetical protein [uncultured Chryseobacterium sp.]|uniref:hypothetical protein n=1 Tax=uncultured Chryseobacterium sp. TaxID=259322 RepID=UPI0025F4BCC3|nr:hypothetical protein [uncultured Chryseobacterium sp.]
MSTITIHLKDKEEETFMENLLKKMKIRFEKEEDDFELTEEMKRLIDERKAKNHTEFTTAKDFLQKLKKDHGI